MKPTKKTGYSNWHLFHFGREFVTKNQPLPDYFGKSYNNCYIMFADFTNFTTFFSASDNLEDIEPILQDYYTKARHVIHQHHGMLDKILGDGFLAVWGLHDKSCDIENCLAKCVVELNELSLNVAKRWQKIIDIHVEETGMSFGLAKGRLITIRRNKTLPGLSILGNSINMAARLEKEAGSGELMCSNKAHSGLAKLNLNFKENPTETDIKGFGNVKSFKIDINDIKNGLQKNCC